MVTFQEAKKKIEDSLHEDVFIKITEETEHGWVFAIANKNMQPVAGIEILIVIDKEDGVQTKLYRTVHQIIARISVNEIYEEMRKERLGKQ